MDPAAAASDRLKVELVPHDPKWVSIAAAETDRVAKALGETLITIHHVGSTAIPGIVAKPTIDLMPIVHSLMEADEHEAEIRALGYEWRGEFGLEGRRYCTLTDASGRRLFNVHVFEAGSPHARRMLCLRDYLRANPAEALAYGAEKQRAATLHPDDTLAYNAEKEAWIQACEQRTQAWADEMRS